MKRFSPAIILCTAFGAAALLGGCASAGYNPNAQEPSWSKSMNSMGNDMSNSLSPEGAQQTNNDLNNAGNDASKTFSPEGAQKASDETNKAGAQADSSLYQKKNDPADKTTQPAKKEPAKTGGTNTRKGK